MAVIRRKLKYRHPRRQGKRDGRDWRLDLFSPGSFFRRAKEPFPAVDEQLPPPFENNLREFAESEMEELAKEWRKADERLKERFCTAAAELQLATDALPKEAREAEEARARLSEHQRKIDELGAPHLSGPVMLSLLVMIAVLEYPLNAIVFQLFGEGQLGTHVAAVGIAIVIPLLAHFFGSSLRKEERTVVDRWLLVASPTFVLGMLAAVSWLRGRFLAEGEVARVVGISVGVVESTVLFLAINMGFYFAAMLISYNGTHPRHELYASWRKRLKELQRSAARESAESVQAGKRWETASKERQRAQIRRRGRYQHYRQRATEVAERVETAVWVYRNANIDVRPDGKVPPAFRVDPRPAQLPEALARELPDEQCAEASETKGATA